MFSKVISAILFTALAGRVVLADDAPVNFNVTIGTQDFLAAEALPTSFPAPFASCQATCQLAQNNITACDPTDFNCLCGPLITAIPGPLHDCEQCIFNQLILANKPQPDPRAGANQVLAGWTSNCANHSLAAPLALTLEVPWDGPFVSVFPEGTGIVIAAIGGVLGSSLIYMLCNM